MPATLSCPQCRNRMSPTATGCPACKCDLRPLAAVEDLANRYFNGAVRNARARRWDLAAEGLVAALALVPDDAEARELLAQVRSLQARDGRRDGRHGWHDGRRGPRPRWARSAGRFRG